MGEPSFESQLSSPCLMVWKSIGVREADCNRFNTSVSHIFETIQDCDIVYRFENADELTVRSSFENTGNDILGYELTINIFIEGLYGHSFVYFAHF
jgi:hypothetical protein